MNLDFVLIQKFAFGLIGALVVIIVGFPIANYLANLMSKAMEKRKLDESLRKFLASMVKIIFKVLVLLTAADVAGADVTSFVAIIGAMGFAVGLAFQGALANFAGGILLLVLRPFKVGDFINATGEQGVVEEIGIIYTKLLTVDKKSIVIPNGVIANGNVTNFSAQAHRRVDLTIGASYDAPVEDVKSAIRSVLERHEKVLKDPPYFVRLGAHNASSLDYTVRAWVNNADYWDVHFDLIEAVTKKFQAEGISIPYNILDVNLNQNPQ